ncbi:hypothetical protein [Hymenobacter jeollabukensis]|nr:hypothetical protein [Hymenobacter jeollabukensis]
MKKAVLLLTAAASLALGACNKTTCPAYSKADNKTAEPVASAEAPQARQ